MSAGLSEFEWRQLLELLRRFADHDLDQFDGWQLDTSYGPVFVQLRRELSADEPAAAFPRVEPVSDYSTGRAGSGDHRFTLYQARGTPPRPGPPTTSPSNPARTICAVDLCLAVDRGHGDAP